MVSSKDQENQCRDDFVRFQEGSYSSGREFCRQTTNNNRTSEFVSEANQVSIDLFYTTLEGVGFTAYFEVVQNLYFITESEEENNTGFIHSPFFPDLYPRHYSTEYFFSNPAPFGRVLLLFSDFEIGQLSQLEVIDTNGSSIGVYSGDTFRPPPLLSSGSALGVKFSANRKSAPGFRAQYFFRHASAGSYIAPALPDTNCGGLISNAGGNFKLNRPFHGNHWKPYDCIWIIKFPTYPYSVTQLSLKLEEFTGMAKDSKLEVRKGVHSTSTLQQVVTPENYHRLSERTWILTSEMEGFYVRFQGSLNSNSSLIMTYTAFDYWSCFGELGSLCTNNRCIHRTLFCDGFDHCGDGSDEQPALCYATGLSDVHNSIWWRNTQSPNYFFPHGYSPRAVDLPLLACCLALVVMLSSIGLALCWILKRKSKRRRNAAESRPGSSAGGSEIFCMELRLPESPPRYDPPPSYEDISKNLFQHIQMQAAATVSTNPAHGTQSSNEHENQTESNRTT